MAKEISSELLNTILTRVGGPGNIASCGNCMTRLRLGVHDSSLVDPDIKTLEGVKGVILTSDQVQVVFGPGKAHRADDLYLRTGVQQRADAGFTESGRSGHAARHLADGDDRVDCRTGKPGVRHSAGLAGDAL